MPVRLETSLRAPSFDGLRLEVDGEFDNFDSLLRAKMVAVKETGMAIGSTKRLGVWAAFFSLILLVALPIVVIWIVTGELIFSAGDSEDTSRVALAFILSIALNIVAAIFVFAAFLYLSKVAIPALFEAFDRILRRFTEYRSK